LHFCISHRPDTHPKMSHPCESGIAIRLLAAVGIISQVVGAQQNLGSVSPLPHVEPVRNSRETPAGTSLQAKGDKLSLLSLKASSNEKLMDAVWGASVMASYRAWHASPHSPSSVNLDAQASAAYRDWKVSRDDEVSALLSKQPSDTSDRGIVTAITSGVGKDTAESSGVGQATAQAAGVGKEAAHDVGVGKATAEDQFLGRKTASESKAGQITAREEGAGRKAAMESGQGREMAIAHRAGVHTAKKMGIGNAEGAGESTCFDAVNVTDAGYEDEFRGWYDVQGCGQCNDYCRWVGAGSEGDPFESQSQNGAFWSCHLSSSDDEYTPQDHFARWMHPRCDGRGIKAPCMEAQEEVQDTGFTDEFQGWYDVQGCGVCNDYCRWVGRSGSGGDPTNRLAKGDSWWSCQLAGHDITHTNLGRFGRWTLPRCDGKGTPAPESSSHHLITEPPPLSSD